MAKLNSKKNLLTPDEILIYEKMPVAMSVSYTENSTSYLLCISEGLCKLLSVSRKTLLSNYKNKPLVRIHPEDSAKAYLEIKKATLHPEAEFKTVFRMKTKTKYIRVLCTGCVKQISKKKFIQYFTYSNILDIPTFTDTDELKKTTAALQNSRNIYEKAAKSAHLGIWTYNIKQHTIVMSSDRFTKNNYKNHNLYPIVKNVPEALLNNIEEKSKKGFLEMYKKVDNGTDASCEVWFNKKAVKEPRCERLSYAVERDETGKAVKAYGISQDITNEKKSEEQYKQELVNLNGINGKNLIAKSRHNLTKNKVIVYTPFSNQSIFLKQDISFTTFCKLLKSKTYIDSAKSRIAEILDRKMLLKAFDEGKTNFSFRYCRELDRHRVCWVYIIINTYQVPSTKDIECFIYAYDVTQKILQEQIVSKLWNLGYDGLGIIYLTTKTCTIYHGDSITNTITNEMALPYEEIIKALVTKYLISEDEFNSLSLKNISSKLEDTNIYSVTIAFHNEKTTLQKQFQFSYLDEYRNSVFLCICDITTQYQNKQKQIEMLKKAKFDADKANEAKSSFLSSMSHDLRTPLNGIIGFTNLALKEKNNLKKQNYLKKIHLSSTLLASLVNDTLDLSRIESGKMTLTPESVDSRDLVESVLTTLKPNAELKKINLKIEKYPRQTLWVDRLKLQKILLNLLSNAIKYTKEGGNVSFSLEKINPTVNNCTHRIIVKDNGIGMGEEFQKRLFVPFSQEHRPEAKNISGTGLGLAISKRIIELMGGSINIESKLEKGTCVTVDLPIQTAEFSKKKENSKKINKKFFYGKHILLLEDNYLNTEIVVMILNEKGVIVDTAINGKKGLEKFIKSKENFYDAILMDIRMPVMDGYEATEKIRELRRKDAKTIPIIAMSADAFDEDIKKAKSSGINEYITKPIDPEKMFKTLINLLPQN